MSIPLNTIYSYFETGDFPTEEQFQASWSSFWHKEESIPTNKIAGLEAQLQNKADKNIFEIHVSNPDSHANYLAKKDASNLDNVNVQAWKSTLGVGELPENIATVDDANNTGNVYTKNQSDSRYMFLDDFVNDDEKILAEKIEALGLTTLIEATENTISEFANHSNLYEFEDNDFIAIPDNNGNYSLFMFKGGEKTDKKNYLPTGISNVTMGMVEGLQAALNGKVDKPLLDGNFYIKRQSGVTTTEQLADETLKSVVNRGSYTPKSIKFGEEEDPYYFGINKTNFNLYITKKNPDTDPATGIVNVGIGFQSLDNLTSGNYNSVVGSYSGSKITTGARNSFLGNQVGSATTTGSDNVFMGTKTGFTNTDGAYNTFIGANAGIELTRGSDNTFIGSGAGINHGKGTSGLWGQNVFIGAGAATTAHAMGTRGDGNIVIGPHAPLGGGNTRMLVIDSYNDYVRHDQVKPFINGDMVNRWLSLDAALQIIRTPVADSTYTKVALMSPDNTIGYKNLSDFTNFIPITGTLPSKPVTGDIEFSTGTPAIMKSGNTWVTINNGNFDVSSGTSISASDKSLLVVNQNEVYIGKQNLDGPGKHLSLSNFINYIDIGAEHNGPGLVGSSYYGDNYTDQSFVQKRWVEERINKPSYKIYKALLQTDENYFEPKFIVLENTIGDITWKRNDVGFYTGMLGKAFPKGKVWINSKINVPFKKSFPVDCMAVRFDDDIVNLNILTHSEVYIPVDMGGEFGIIEIYVYD